MAGSQSSIIEKHEEDSLEGGAEVCRLERMLDRSSYEDLLFLPV